MPLFQSNTDVKYIAISSDHLGDVGVIPGQIIALTDRPAWYYDQPSGTGTEVVRRCITEFVEFVTTLPTVGVPGRIYVKDNGLHFWVGVDASHPDGYYHMNDVANDNSVYYRRNRDWIKDTSTVHITSSGSYANMVSYVTTALSSSDKVKIIGTLSGWGNNQISIPSTKSCTELDFSACTFKNTSTSVAGLNISLSGEVLYLKGVHMKAPLRTCGINITGQGTVYIEDCSIEGTAVSPDANKVLNGIKIASSSTLVVNITDCTFDMNSIQNSGVFIDSSNSNSMIRISNCSFIKSSDASVDKKCISGLTNVGRYDISDNRMPNTKLITSGTNEIDVSYNNIVF